MVNVTSDKCYAESRMGLGISRERTDGRPRSLFEFEGLRRACDHGLPRVVLSSGLRRASRRRHCERPCRERHRRRRLDQQSTHSRPHAGIPGGRVLPDPQPQCASGPGSSCWSRCAGIWCWPRGWQRMARVSLRAGILVPPSGRQACVLDWQINWHSRGEMAPHGIAMMAIHPREAHFLKLDASKAKTCLGWHPRLPLPQALEWIVEWYRAFQAGADLRHLPECRLSGMKHFRNLNLAVTNDRAPANLATIPAILRAVRGTELASGDKVLQMPNIVVLGTGMAGFGAAHRLHSEGITPVMYDKNGYSWRPYNILPLRHRLCVRHGSAYFLHQGSRVFRTCSRTVLINSSRPCRSI